LSKYSEVGRADEMYASCYTCHACHGKWRGDVYSDPAQPGVWPLITRFCPCCGVRFSGEERRRESTERRHELLCQAHWKSHAIAEARKIRYEIQSRAEHRPQWGEETGYYMKGTREEVVRSWRQRLHDGSWFGEEVRLVAFTSAGEKVVFGPVTLPPKSLQEDE
jgi:hypothetical protein